MPARRTHRGPVYAGQANPPGPGVYRPGEPTGARCIPARWTHRGPARVASGGAAEYE